MDEQVRVQTLLIGKFQEMKARNPSFSIRAFASRLQMQPSATNEIIKGQRRVSRKIAERIADRLQLDPSERSELLKDFPSQLKRKLTKEKQLETLKLNAFQFELISDWVHLAILSLLRTSNFNSDVSWIAERLNVTELEARKAILKLQHLGLIQLSPDGRMGRTAQEIRTSDDVRDLSIQNMHINDMEMAKKKINDLKVDQRDFSNYTFPANPEGLARAKEILRKAQDDLAALMYEGPTTEVFRVCMYLFPLTTMSSNSPKT